MKYFKIVENSINKSHSLISLFTKLFTAMLIFLGIITGISAVKEVKREVYSCLDEKFSMILFSVSDLVNSEEDIKSEKVSQIINHYKIGDVGFSAIIDISDINNIKVKFISEDAKNSDKELETAIRKDGNFKKYIEESYRPKGFMDLAFKAKQKDLKVSSDNYRMRLCSTNMKNIYVLTAAGHDQYFWKIVRIVLDAIFLTVIAVPITISITKTTFKTLANQIMSLEKAITSLESNTTLTHIVRKLWQSLLLLT